MKSDTQMENEIASAIYLRAVSALKKMKKKEGGGEKGEKKKREHSIIKLCPF